MILLTEFRPPAYELAAFDRRNRAMSKTRCNMRLILSMGLLTVCGTALAGEPFAIDWHTIDAGGGTSTGGDFELTGTIGQHDASNTLTGGDWELAGGFWPGVATTDLCAGVECDDGVTCTTDSCSRRNVPLGSQQG